MNPALVTPPAPVLTVAAVKANLRILHFDEDTLIASLIDAAMSWLDGWDGALCRCIGPQEWRSTACAFAPIRLPFPDLIVVTEIRYTGADGTEHVLPSTEYQATNGASAGWVLFTPTGALPALADVPDAIRITARYGFEPVPPALITAATMLASHWYEHREGLGDIPPAVTALLRPFRRLVA